MNDSAAGDTDARGSRRIWVVGGLTLVLLAALIVFAQARDSRLQSYGFDVFQRLSPRELLATPVIVVEIDERSLAAKGQWPWPRTVLAELIRKPDDKRASELGGRTDTTKAPVD